MSEIKLHCKRHPKYQAKRPPRANCEVCQFLWQEAQRKGQTP